MGVLTLQTDYESEKGYLLDNSSQTDDASYFENVTVLILDKQFNPPDFIHLFIRHFLTDFGDGLSVLIRVKGAKGG